MRNLEQKLIHATDSIEVMSEAARLVDEIIAAENKTRKSRMWIAAYMMLVIQYSKPFKDSRDADRRRYRFPEPDYLSGAELIAHNRLIELRDRFIAHRDLSFLGQNVSYLEDENGVHPIVCKRDHNVLVPEPEEIQPLIASAREMLLKSANQIREEMRRAQ